LHGISTFLNKQAGPEVVSVSESSCPRTAQRLSSLALWKEFRLPAVHPTFLLKVAAPMTTQQKWTYTHFLASMVHSYLLSEWTVLLEELIPIHFICHSFYKGINLQKGMGWDGMVMSLTS